MNRGDIVYNKHEILYYRPNGNGILKANSPLVIDKVINNMIVCQRFGKSFIIHKDE
jgi:hypothetical protein